MRGCWLDVHMDAYTSAVCAALHMYACVAYATEASTRTRTPRRVFHYFRTARMRCCVIFMANTGPHGNVRERHCNDVLQCKLDPWLPAQANGLHRMHGVRSSRL